MLLSDNVTTRAGVLKEGVFVTGDAFTVFGRRFGEGAFTTVFDGVTVTKVAGGGWTYSPPKTWEWVNESNYYDFLAVYPAGTGSAIMDLPGNLAVSTPYDVTTDNYDLLSAAYRRSGSEVYRTAVVPMEFSHMLSAVRVVVENQSQATSLTLNSYGFRHMTESGEVKTTLDLLANAEFQWVNTEHSSSEVRSVTLSPEVTLVGTGVDGTHSYTGEYDLMIPQDLTLTSNGSSNPAYLPRLCLSYAPDGEDEVTAEIILKDVTRDDSTAIDSWLPGLKYTYLVRIRIDGGVEVNLITTEWEVIEAETPGLLID